MVCVGMAKRLFWQDHPRLMHIDNDQLFPDEIREAGVKHLQEQKIQYELKEYPGVPHGFAVIGEYEDPKIQEAQKAAFAQMLAWLKSQ
jgi:dienelactone hydrolase